MTTLAYHYGINLNEIPDDAPSRVWIVECQAREKGYTFIRKEGEPPLEPVFPPGRILCVETGGYNPADLKDNP